MTTAQAEPLTLEVDGCWVDSQDVQHYTFPREAIGGLDEQELAIAESLWSRTPQCQGQWEEGMEQVTPDWDGLFESVEEAKALQQDDELVELEIDGLPVWYGHWVDLEGTGRCAFPRELLWDGSDDDVLALMEWVWHTHPEFHPSPENPALNRDGFIAAVIEQASQDSPESSYAIAQSLLTYASSSTN